MPTANHIKSLLQSHTAGDDERFYAVALQVAAAEARKGHQKLAEELRELIRASRKNLDESKLKGSVVSFAAPNGEAAEILESVPTHLKVSDLVLEKSLAERIQRILHEQKNLCHHRRCDYQPGHHRGRGRRSTAVLPDGTSRWPQPIHPHGPRMETGLADEASASVAVDAQ